MEQIANLIGSFAFMFTLFLLVAGMALRGVQHHIEKNVNQHLEREGIDRSLTRLSIVIIALHGLVSIPIISICWLLFNFWPPGISRDIYHPLGSWIVQPMMYGMLIMIIMASFVAIVFACIEQVDPFLSKIDYLPMRLFLLLMNVKFWAVGIIASWLLVFQHFVETDVSILTAMGEPSNHDYVLLWWFIYPSFYSFPCAITIYIPLALIVWLWRLTDQYV